MKKLITSVLMFAMLIGGFYAADKSIQNQDLFAGNPGPIGGGSPVEAEPGPIGGGSVDL
jgi:hypothetical protein